MEKKFRYHNQTEQLLGELGGAGRSIAAALWEQKGKDRIESLDNTVLANGTVIEVLGIPRYLEDVTAYTAYGLTESGWYCFARITSRDGSKVDANTTVTGDAGHIMLEGAEYIDVAVKFDVAAMKQRVVINWGTYEDDIVFSASDLAIRNLDYRTTFYVYDISPYATWEYAFTADTTFQEGKKYFTKSGDVYSQAEVQTVAYVLTSDATFQVGKTYYISDGQGGYTQAQVQTVAYELTADETFQDGKTYYISDGAGGYTAATVTAGEAVTADTYYEQTTVPVPANTYYEQTTVPVPAYYVQTHPYALTTDTTFQDGVTYYTKGGSEYVEATVTTGASIPAYYNHSKVIFQGMARNVTYQLDEIIDCPQEYILPEIEDDGHGAWFEIRLRHSGSFSSTLVVPEGVKIATEHTQAETAGMNMVDLHYMSIDGIKIWRFMNTHSSIPTT